MSSVGDGLEEARRLVTAGRLAEAEAAYRRLVEHNDQSHELWGELGLFYFAREQFEPAAECLERGVALAPGDQSYQAMLGSVCLMLNRHAAAASSFRQALAIGPPSAKLYNNLALALRYAARDEEALAAFDQAVIAAPDYANGYFNRGNLLADLGRMDEAAESYAQAARVAPRDTAVLCKLGMAYYDLGRSDEALAAYERALEVQPDYAEAHRNRALVLLGRGQYAEGWKEYEWRLKCDDAVKRDIAVPRWDGSPLAGRTLFVYAEQGLGDTLQFVRYLPLVERDGKVLMEATGPLVPLLEQSGFGPCLVAPGSPPNCDVACALLSLPGLAAAARGDPFWDRPYLAADPRLTAAWKDRLRDVPGFRIGIVWAGHPAHPHDRFRSAKLLDFVPLASVPGVRLISLQKGKAALEAAIHARHIDVVDLSAELDVKSGAFIDTAAIVRQLDLVIAVDTAVAHVAGGLGARVWLALDYSPDWRWLSEGQSTAWYPSMRLFRQRQSGDWQGVFAEMAGELRGLVAGVRTCRGAN